MYAVDTNSGTYSNQVQFDLSQFANVTNGFLNFAEATLEIPIVITATAPDAVAGPACLDNFLSTKNGAWSFINSMSLNIDGKECIQPNNMFNSWVSYRVLSSFSADD